MLYDVIQTVEISSMITVKYNYRKNDMSYCWEKSLQYNENLTVKKIKEMLDGIFIGYLLTDINKGE